MPLGRKRQDETVGVDELSYSEKAFTYAQHAEKLANAHDSQAPAYAGIASAYGALAVEQMVMQVWGLMNQRLPQAPE